MANVQTLGQKATKSVIALTSRTFILNVLNFAGAAALTVFLSPQDFGIFILTSTIVDILAYFSDIGLAGAIIQKKTELGDREVYATFTIQMCLVTLGIIIALFFSQSIQAFYGLDIVGRYLLYALLASFFLSSLKTIPSVLSERNLQFNNIVIPQIIETVLFNIIIVVLAWKGFGVKSYIVAVLVRAIAGTITIYYLVRWKPKLYFSLEAIKGLLKFGIPYQLNSLVAVFKDRVSLLILGKIIGLSGIGILGWAEKWANLPLRYFVDSTIKVSFPLFSRVQGDLDKAKSALEQSIYLISVLVFPALAFAFVAMPYIFIVFPQYAKWEPGLSTFNLFLISAAIAAISTFFTNFLTAMGRVKAVLGLMIMWTVLTLTLYPLFALKLGYQGVAIASVLISSTSIITYVLVRRVLPVDLFGQIISPLIASLILIAGTMIAKPFFPQTIVGLIEIGLLAGLLYCGALCILDFKRLKIQITTFLAYAKA